MPARLLENAYVKGVLDFFNLKSNVATVTLISAAIFGIGAFLAGFSRLVLIWFGTRFAFSVGADLSIDIYRRTLYQPYSTHLGRNSSEIINGVVNKVQNVISYTISPLVSLWTNAIMLMIISVALLMVNPFLAIIVFVGFAAVYFSIAWFTRKRLEQNGHVIARTSSQLIKAMQEGLGGIRDILISGSQETFCNIYTNADLQLRKAQASNLFIVQNPRYILEAIVLIAIALIACYFSDNDGDIALTLPILGVLALGGQRLLPVLQQLYSCWSQIQGNSKSLHDTLDFLAQPLPEFATSSQKTPMIFSNTIKSSSISYKYSSDSKAVLDNISFEIFRGDRVGIIGKTGSGKSTLVDVITGLLAPTEGVIYIDSTLINDGNRHLWQANIAYVPQTIFLADASIAENIAFGVSAEEIDLSRVAEAACKAQIADTILALPKKYSTIVGERGVFLSGGQRQRIGIARALYKSAKVLIFDEATSALDYETEAAVMSTIYGLSSQLTIIIVAHRISTLEGCSKIIELREGRIVVR